MHRLDRPTYGLVVVAKTRPALVALSKAFANRRVQKRYVAIVSGSVDHDGDEGMIDTPISGAEAETRFVVRGHGRCLTWGWITSLDLWPRTGRRHQLRRHLAESLGHHILGDSRYGSQGSRLGAPSSSKMPGSAVGLEEAEHRRSRLEASEPEEPEDEDQRQEKYVAKKEEEEGLFLAAVEVSFTHPISGELVCVSIPEPAKFHTRMGKENLGTGTPGAGNFCL